MKDHDTQSKTCGSKMNGILFTKSILHSTGQRSKTCIVFAGFNNVDTRNGRSQPPFLDSIMVAIQVVVFRNGIEMGLFSWLVFNKGIQSVIVHVAAASCRGNLAFRWVWQVAQW
jgi:hypothetical protein